MSANVNPLVAQVVEAAARSVVFVTCEVSTGSGFCVGMDGDDAIIVTNSHVVGQEGTAHAVSLGQKLHLREATLVGWHPFVDIAVLRARLVPDPTPLPWRLDSVQVAEEVLAVGSPRGFSLSFSKGIVSGVDREFAISRHPFPATYIQTDSLTNPGSSGGPLIGLDGEVVGVNAMSHFEGGRPIPFAVPAELAVSAVEAILGRTPEGVSVGRAGMRWSREFWSRLLGDEGSRSEATQGAGVLMMEPDEDSPAALAGIEEGDRLLSIGSQPVDHPADIYAWLIRSESWLEGATLVFQGPSGVPLREVVLRAEREVMELNEFTKH